MDISTLHQTIGSAWKLLILLGISIINGLLLAATYRVGSKEEEQPAQPFTWLIVILPSLVAVLVFMVQDNFLMALYLLGATALIRFRNPVKYPLNTILILATVGTGAAAGFGFFAGSILLSLLCFLIIRTDCLFLNKTEMFVTRVVFLNCHNSIQPDKVFEKMGKCFRKWTKLSLETSISGDYLYWNYQVQIRKQQEISDLIDKFESFGVKAQILEPRDLKEF